MYLTLHFLLKKEEEQRMTERKNLVIVESPAKAGTIQKFLGDDYVVKSSSGTGICFFSATWVRIRWSLGVKDRLQVGVYFT